MVQYDFRPNRETAVGARKGSNPKMKTQVHTPNKYIIADPDPPTRV